MPNSYKKIRLLLIRLFIFHMYSVVMRKYLGAGGEPAPACVPTDKEPQTP